MIENTQQQKPVYLIIADETPEFPVAVRYAAHSAKAHGARLAVLYVMEPENIQAFDGLQQRIHQDMRGDAQRLLDNVAEQAGRVMGISPDLFIMEGGRLEAVSEFINNNPAITKLILAGSCENASPGPLVSYFTGKGLMKLRVPLTIVPEHLSAFAETEK